MKVLKGHPSKPWQAVPGNIFIVTLHQLEDVLCSKSSELQPSWQAMRQPKDLQTRDIKASNISEILINSHKITLDLSKGNWVCLQTSYLLSPS